MTVVEAHSFTGFAPKLIRILTGGGRVIIPYNEDNRGISASQIMLISLETSTVKDGNTFKFTSG